MHLTRRYGLNLTLAALALATGTAVAAFGCKASVTAGTEAAAPTNTVAEAPPPPPPVDTDGDGIPDDKDACKDKAGKENADAAKNGCPEEPQVAMAAAPVKKVKIEDNEVKIDEKIMFDVGSDVIKPESDKLLDELAEVLKGEGKDIELVEVGGHADKSGDDKKNLALTDKRAKAVVEALVKRGVDAKRLRAKGYGEYCPVDPADTPEAHEKNRRVQFAILKMGGKKTGVKLGCDEAAKKGVKPQPIF